MRISHIGQASLPTYTSQTLQLRNVLRVPSVTNNLLSVKKLTLIAKKKLTRDNDVFVEFHPFDLFVKD
jgi:hypothetical protein